MTPALRFEDLARLPVPEDNVAIATRQLEAGSLIQHAGERFQLSHTVLVGHRFVVRPIAAGDWLDRVLYDINLIEGKRP